MDTLICVYLKNIWWLKYKKKINLKNFYLNSESSADLK